MANNKISELVSKFKLEGHPEGGFYRRFFQSEEMMDTIHGPRHRMTSINFLLTKESFSALHLLKQSNEIFYHHQGASVRIHLIYQDGKYENVIVSKDNPTYVVNPNIWFAAEVIPEEDEDFAFFSCAVSPGFDFADFVLSKKSELLGKFPQHAQIIQAFCRDE